MNYHEHYANLYRPSTRTTPGGGAAGGGGAHQDAQPMQFHPPIAPIAPPNHYSHQYDAAVAAYFQYNNPQQHQMAASEEADEYHQLLQYDDIPLPEMPKADVLAPAYEQQIQQQQGVVDEQQPNYQVNEQVQLFNKKHDAADAEQQTTTVDTTTLEGASSVEQQSEEVDEQLTTTVTEDNNAREEESSTPVAATVEAMHPSMNNSDRGELSFDLPQQIFVCLMPRASIDSSWAC